MSRAPPPVVAIGQGGQPEQSGAPVGCLLKLYSFKRLFELDSVETSTQVS